MLVTLSICRKIDLPGFISAFSYESQTHDKSALDTTSTVLLNFADNFWWRIGNSRTGCLHGIKGERDWGPSRPNSSLP